MTGGGTLGPVTPLIAIAEAWKKLDPNIEFIWFGTSEGPEGDLLKKLGYRFFSIKTAKLSRHFAFSTLIAPIVLYKSYFKARDLIKKEKPDLVMSAGGYVSVPFVWAAKTLKTPTWIHQLDVRPGLANRMMANFASKITTSWEKSLQNYPKGEWLGTPVRESLRQMSRERVYREYQLDSEYPTVLILGGGLGAEWINKTMAKIGPDLIAKANVIHQTGKGKDLDELEAIGGRYHVKEFIYEMDKAYAAANLVVCRAGMGTISELAFLRKPTILIPIPGNQQEDNAATLLEANAAIVFDQAMAPGLLSEKITNLLEKQGKLREMGNNISKLIPTEGVATKIAKQARLLASSQ